MMIVNIPVEVITFQNSKGKTIPMRIRFDEGDEQIVIQNIQVKSVDTEGFRTNMTYLYTCRAIHNGMQVEFVLRFIPMETRWVLYKK